MSCYEHYPNYGHLFPLNTKLVILTTEDYKFTGTLDAVICFSCDNTNNYCYNVAAACNQTYQEKEKDTLIKLTVQELQHNGTIITTTFPTEAYINAEQIIAIGRA